MSPRPPSQECLDAHYGDSLPIFEGQQLDYSIDKRIAFISKRLPKNGSRGTYLEVGSNKCPQFLEETSKLFSSCLTVEINKSCDSAFDSVADAPLASADILAAYFVLEHIPAPVDFLRSCARVLKDSGTIIIEVPDLYVYPELPDGLALHEHVNHFSIRTLSRIAAMAGLRLADASRALCSRPYGFAAAFTKATPLPPSAAPDHFERVIAKACMNEGAERLRNFRRSVDGVRGRIDEAARNGTVVIWAANQMCQILLDGYQPPVNVVVVDSDPRKRNYFEAVPVLQPEAAIPHIKSAVLFVVNTKLYCDEILSWIRGNAGRTVSKSELLVFDAP